MLLEGMAWPDVKDLVFRNWTILIPLGSFEQHGPHLPFNVDTTIVTAIARRVETQLSSSVLCLPTIWLGHSTHHLAFPGTMSVRQMHYIELLRDVCESIVGMGGRKLFFLNGHGGNEIPMQAALREVKSQFAGIAGLQVVAASYWSIAQATIERTRESDLGGLGHACEMETSIMLYLEPGRVHMERARRGGSVHSSRFRKLDMQAKSAVYKVDEFSEISENGVVGWPDIATPEKGKTFLEGIVSEVTSFVQDFQTW